MPTGPRLWASEEHCRCLTIQVGALELHIVGAIFSCVCEPPQVSSILHFSFSFNYWEMKSIYTIVYCKQSSLALTAGSGSHMTDLL